MRVRGGGQVELAAYGMADAEHQVEKEVRALWPEAGVSILEVGRSDGGARIVEEFRIRYRLNGTILVDEETDAEARKTALRVLRDRFSGSRFERIAWEAVE